MIRHTQNPRNDWARTVEGQGLHFHSPEGETYWDESVCYEFLKAEIDMLEVATYELNDLCLAAVEAVIQQNRWDDFNIAEPFREWIKTSWERDETTIIGRFDFAFDGKGPPKLLEYNADTPTSLLEASVIQWYWLQDTRKGKDQFNTLHERLIEAWKTARERIGGERLLFLASPGHVEDYMNTQYLRDTAMQAGLVTDYLPINKLGYNAPRRQFMDLSERPVQHAFKLYPYEWLFAEEFGQYLPLDNVNWYEPPWKVILSNKAILAVLWELFPDNQYLLEASLAPLNGNHVKKPRQSREGAGVGIHWGGQRVAGEDTADQPAVYQRYQPIKPFDGKTPVIGSWMVNGYAAGMGIREDDGMITGNLSRFVPHFFS